MVVTAPFDLSITPRPNRGQPLSPESPLGQDQKRCDYLFVAEDPADSGWVVPLELKSGRVDVFHSVEQLQAGARFAEEKNLPKAVDKISSLSRMLGTHP